MVPLCHYRTGHHLPCRNLLHVANCCGGAVAESHPGHGDHHAGGMRAPAGPAQPGAAVRINGQSVSQHRPSRPRPESQGVTTHKDEAQSFKPR